MGPSWRGSSACSAIYRTLTLTSRCVAVRAAASTACSDGRPPLRSEAPCYRSSIGIDAKRLTSSGPAWPLVVVGAVGVLGGVVLLRESAIGGLFVIALCGLFFMVGVAQLRMSRALRRLSDLHARTGPRPPRTRCDGWTPPPPLDMREISVDKAPRVSIPTGVPILFLWVFDRSTTGSLLHRLNRIGPVYLLRGGGILAFDLAEVPRMAFGRIDRMIEENETEVMQRLQRFRVRRRLGYYSLLTMACTDSVWTFALDRMVERCRVTVVDLSDFVPDRAGIAYEIGLLLDRVSLEHVVFVIGPDTDRDGLRRLMLATWDTLAPESPNRRNERAVATMAITTSLVESNGASRDGFTAATKRDRELVAALVAEAAQDQ